MRWDGFNNSWSPPATNNNIIIFAPTLGSLGTTGHVASSVCYSQCHDDGLKILDGGGGGMYYLEDAKVTDVFAALAQKYSIYIIRHPFSHLISSQLHRDFDPYIITYGQLSPSEEIHCLYDLPEKMRLPIILCIAPRSLSELTDRL